MKEEGSDRCEPRNPSLPSGPMEDIRRTEGWRLANGLSKSALARRLGWAPSTYTRWVRRESELTYEHIDELARLTRVPLIVYYGRRQARLRARAA